MMKSFWEVHSMAEVFIESLRNNICLVNFTKNNGEERLMRCTLMEKYLPNDDRKDTETPLHKRKSLAIVVWDLDNNGWRSFLPNSVMKFDVESCLVE